jgi:hypothetical protein
MILPLPKHWSTYYNSIRDRCQSLIDLKIWSGIDINSLNAWKKNFKSDEEKYFSACILDSLIYRSNDQTYSLIHQLLYKNLNNLLRSEGIQSLTKFPLNIQTVNPDPLVRFVPVMTSEDPVTKSSYEILRFMKRFFSIKECWIINPSEIERCLSQGVKTVVFIDDFLGTGKQFDEICIYANIYDLIKKSNIVYAPLVAHEDGISYLKTIHPNLKITCVEMLTSKNHSFFKNYFPSCEEEAKMFYVDLMKNRNLEFDPVEPFGYGNMELTYSFEHSSPDNSLQILNKSSDNWKPLFNR